MAPACGHPDGHPYYLNHRDTVEEYLRQQELAGDPVQADIESQTGYQTAMQEFVTVCMPLDRFARRLEIAATPTDL